MHVLIPIVIILLRVSLAMTCHSFKDTNVTVVSKIGEKYHTVVSGCLERKLFQTTIVQIYVENQRVEKLERDSIRHLRHLFRISFDETETKTVESALFRNVPRLKMVRIKRNQLVEIVKGVFSNLEKLEAVDLSRNEIEKIESGAFGNLSTLKNVDFGYNNLEIFSPDWFLKSLNVESLNFQHNSIKVLPRRAFSDLPHLKIISFDYNELGLIHPEVFIGIFHLKYLGLRYNRLKSINPRSFPNRVFIEDLSIDANYLNFLPMRMVSNVRVKSLSYIGNPWKCPCLDEIHHWLFESNGTVKTPDFCRGRDVPVCCFPKTFSHTCREEVDDELTGNYLGKLKLMNPPLNPHCARLDRVGRMG